MHQHKAPAPVDRTAMEKDLRAIFDGDGLVRPSLLRSRPYYYLGVDFGQAQDYSAMAIVERVELVRRDLAGQDPLTRAWPLETRFFVRYVERMALGTPYPEVVKRVERLAMKTPLAKGQVKVIVDATGVGAAVVDLLKQGPTRSGLLPVTITSGRQETTDASRYCVPRRDLLGGLVLALQQRRVQISRGPGSGSVRELLAEMRSMTIRDKWGDGSGDAAHDDLVFALALAWWRANRETGWGAAA